VSDAVGNDAGLAGSGAGEQQERSFDMLNGLTLLGIEPLEKIHVIPV
jgi:hypothetical protein